MKNNGVITGFAAVAAILLVIVGAVRVSWFVIGLAILIAVLVVAHFWGDIRRAIHNFFKNYIPKEIAWMAWIILTGIGTVGALTYFMSGVTARYINASLYLVALVMSVPYMVRRVPETGWYRFWAVVWSFMIIPCIWKLVPFVGWLLAIVDIVLFWHFHYVANYQNQSQAQPQPNPAGKPIFGRHMGIGPAINVYPWWSRRPEKNLWQGNQVYYAYARISYIRLPNPFVWYAYSVDQKAAYRDTFFRSSDAQEIANIYDCNYPKSGGIHRILRGNIHMEFDYTKLGKPTVTVWPNMDPELAAVIHNAHAQKKK